MLDYVDTLVLFSWGINAGGINVRMPGNMFGRLGMGRLVDARGGWSSVGHPEEETSKQ